MPRPVVSSPAAPPYEHMLLLRVVYGHHLLERRLSRADAPLVISAGTAQNSFCIR